MRSTLAAIIGAAVLAACSNSKPAETTPDSLAVAKSDSALIASPGGFIQPEAVRYDPDQDVYFVNSWGNGDPGAKDNNGFISRMTPDGTVERLRFIAGGAGGATLHAPRGMTIVGDTLWVVDADAVRAFNRRTGAPLATVDFSAFKLGFLNDIAAGPDGLYITDTGTNRIYRIAGGRVSLALEDPALGGPNGITWDANNRRFIVVPYGGESAIKAWAAGSKALSEIHSHRGRTGRYRCRHEAKSRRRALRRPESGRDLAASSEVMITRKCESVATATTLSEKWLGTESNRRHADFQSAALPTELPSRTGLRRPE